MAIGPIGGGSPSGAAAIAQQQQAVRDLTRQLVAEPAAQALELSNKLIRVGVAQQVRQANAQVATGGVGSAFDMLA